MSTQKKFYAVQKGRLPGVYNSWQECQAQVVGFSKPVFRKFSDYQKALDFVNGIESRFEVKEQTEWWTKTATEQADCFITDLNQRIETYGRLSTSIDNNNESGAQMAIEKVEVVQLNQQIDRRVQVWISGSDCGMGAIAVFFGNNAEIDKKYDFVGGFQWPKPIEKTRVGLAAFIRAISIFTQMNNHQILHDTNMNMDNVSLVVHVSSKYLYEAIQNWLRALWLRQGLGTEKNADMFKMFKNQMKGNKFKIMVVLETRQDDNMEIAKQMALNYQMPSLFKQ